MKGKAHYIEAFLRIDIDGSGGRPPLPAERPIHLAGRGSYRDSFVRFQKVATNVCGMLRAYLMMCLTCV